MFGACRSDASFGWRADSDVQPEESEMPKALRVMATIASGWQFVYHIASPIFLSVDGF
jgi:hypothetical protein